MGIKRNQLCNWPSLRRYIIFQGRAGVGIDTRCRISYPQHGCAAHVETHIGREGGKRGEREKRRRAAGMRAPDGGQLCDGAAS